MGVQSKISGIVLAGGMSRRLGRDKAVEPVGGEPLIARVLHRVSQVTDQTVVVVNEIDRASALPLNEASTKRTPASVAVDAYPGKGSLGGIFTGLSASDADWGLVVACDMPFLNVELFRHMLSVRDGSDAVVPMVEGRPEPTHAVYSRACLPHMERRLKADDLKISRFFDEVRVRFLSEEEVDSLDPDHLSFFNVNTQADLDRALELVEAGY